MPITPIQNTLTQQLQNPQYNQTAQTVSNPVQYTAPTPVPTETADTFESTTEAKTEETPKKSNKGLIIGLVAAGIAITAGIAYAIKNKGLLDKIKSKLSNVFSRNNEKSSVETMQELGESLKAQSTLNLTDDMNKSEFFKKIKKDKFTGTVKAAVKNGDDKADDLVVMVYKDGVLQESTRSGVKNFTKEYYYNSKGVRRFVGKFDVNDKLVDAMFDSSDVLKGAHEQIQELKEIFKDIENAFRQTDAPEM